MSGRGSRRGSGRDGGSGSVLVVGICAALVSGLLLALAVGSAVVARHRAAAAADLAALAGADVVLGRAAGDPCARALAVLAAHDAASGGCVVAGDGSVTVTAQVAAGGLAGLLGSARSSARAGQATEASVVPERGPA